MKIYFTLFLINLVAQNSWAAVSSALCLNESATLHIEVPSFEQHKQVFWVIKSLDQKVLLEGAGPFSKEAESEDAFSAFDEVSAVSFKNNRAVVVLDQELVMVFNSCIAKHSDLTPQLTLKHPQHF